MKTVKGNLVTLAQSGHFDIIIHGCNCWCTMGSGIAPQIADAFDGPTGPRQIDNFTLAGDEEKLGCISIATYQRPLDASLLYIVNAYTQYDFGDVSGGPLVDYDAVFMAFVRTARFAKSFDFPVKIGYPMIGAGLAGGDWNEIAPIIDQTLADLDHTLVKWDGS